MGRQIRFRLLLPLSIALIVAIFGWTFAAHVRKVVGQSSTDVIFLQRLLDKGGDIFIPKGVYRLSAPLSLAAESGGRVVFAPGTQIERGFDGNALLLITGSHWKIFGGDWSGALPRGSDNDANAAIWLQGHENLVCNATVHDSVRGIGNIGAGNTIVHNFVYDISGIALMQSGASGAKVLYNLTRNIGLEAITLDNSTSGSLVRGNRAVDVCKFGCFGGIGAGDRSDDNRVEANLIEGVAHSSSGAGEPDGSGACIALNGDRNVVADNVCTKINGHGVLINPDRVYATPHANSVSDNWSQSIAGAAVQNVLGDLGARVEAAAREMPAQARVALARTRTTGVQGIVTENCGTEP